MRVDSLKNKIVLIIAAAASAAIFLILFSSGSSLVSALSGRDSSTPITKTKFAMDTICSITLYETSKEEQPEEIFEECFRIIADIENKMSVDRYESEVSEINRNAGIKPVRVSSDTYQVIHSGIEYSEMMSGDFDITVGPLVRLWGISKPDPEVPLKTEIDEAVQLVDYRNVELNEAEQTVFLKTKGMTLDLGGIAKGFAGDVVAELLKSKGVKHATVDLGGNLVTVGSKPDGNDWKVGIQTPFGQNGDYFAILSMPENAIVTSGIYQRYFEENGTIYHHIMNTHTGYPVNNHLVSVSVVCKSSMRADALAKSLTFGVKKGLRFIENQPGVEAIFVTDTDEVYVTQGLKGAIKITDQRYILKD